MHELSIVAALLDQCEELAVKNAVRVPRGGSGEAEANGTAGGGVEEATGKNEAEDEAAEADGARDETAAEAGAGAGGEVESGRGADGAVDEAEAGAAGGQTRPLRISEIHVRIGGLAGVEIDLFVRCFETFKQGSPSCASARLIIEEAPLKSSCPSCGAKNTLTKNTLLCPDCGGKCELEGGEELDLMRVVGE